MAYNKPGNIVASAARTASSNSGGLRQDTGDALNVLVSTTAVTGTTPTLDVSVEWSNDGTNWAVGSPADTFTQITATGKVVKRFSVKAEQHRIVWAIGGTDTPTFTFSVSEYVTLR